ncbi:MAG TPA: SDR family NAD(P)-dependent oxidoreductase, partial [Acidimicrobiales bacterium]|nr:SDR family NAD(P)-dependent oxidoreductase [Acidimicrobiales bacterium]
MVDGATGRAGPAGGSGTRDHGVGATATWDFTGRAVIVTGGSRGIGRGIAEAFLAAGAGVAVCGRSEPAPEELPTAGGRRALFVAADVRDADQAAAMVVEARDRLGGLDVLVNNA